MSINRVAAISRFPTTLFSLAVLLTIGMLGWLTWDSLQSHVTLAFEQEASMRITAVRGTILHLDEVLTMSARMAAATGDSSWEARYRRYETRLDEAIQTARNMAPDFYASKGAAQTDAANVALVAMENQAFSLVRDGRNIEAGALLSSDAYDAQKRIYAKGMNDLVIGLNSVAEQGVAVQEHRLHRKFQAIVVVMSILLISWVYVVRTVSNWKTTLLSQAGQLTALNQTLDDKIRIRTSDLEAARVTAQKDRNRFEQMSAAAPDAVIRMDPLGKIAFWNSAAERIFGYGQSEALGSNLHALLAPENLRDGYEKAFPDFQAKGTGPIVGATRRLDAIHKNGSNFPIEISVSTISTAEGYEAIGIVRDITERIKTERKLSDALEALQQAHNNLKAAQLQLIQAAKLESIGRLAAGIAHEVKNPLAIIIQGLYFMRHADAARKEDVEGVLSDMDRAVDKADSVIRGLLDFSSVRKLSLESQSLNAIVDSALHLVRHEFVKYQVTAEKKLAYDLPALPLDHVKMEQVLVNLLINACHAMPSGGTLRISTMAGQASQAGGQKGQIWADLGRLGDPVVVIEIHDSGKGIPAELVSRLFEPFFTTKEQGKGTGLGLAVVKTIVELHGGLVRLENHPEGGAVATIQLPVNGAGIREESSKNAT